MLKVYLKNLVSCVVTLFALSACIGNDSWCLTTSSDAYSVSGTIKDVDNTPFVLNGNGLDPANPATAPGEWVSTGIAVKSGDQIDFSAIGGILTSMPYGLQSAETGGNNSNDNYIAAAVRGDNTSSYYANNGLGHQIVVLANGSPVYQVNIPGTSNPFSFTAGQNIYVTTKSCTTGDAATNAPSKWTWSNWNTTTVRCSPRGTRNFTVSPPLCKAVHCHRGDGTTCSDSDEWQCQYVVLTSSGAATSNTCGANNNAACDVCGTGTSQYNCEANSSYTNPCYATSGYNNSSGWCGGGSTYGGSPGIRGMSTSNDSPPHGTGASDNVTTPTLNSCGTTDSCWNTNGYRLYAYKAGVICPSGVGCVHLNQSSQLTGGKSFQSQGGTLYLQIINPNSPGSTVDTSAWEASLSSNQQTIAGLITINNTLNDDLYKTIGSTLSTGATSDSDGQLTFINKFNSANSSYTQIATLQTQASTYSTGNVDASVAMASVNTILNNLLTSFTTFSGQLNPNLGDGSTIPWDILSTMSDQIKQVLDLQNSLTNGTTATSNPTATQADTYKTQVTQALTALSNAIIAAQTTQGKITCNASGVSTYGVTCSGSNIDALSAQNDTYTSQILAAQSAATNNAIGGYTTYVRSDPIIVTDGQGLQVIVAQDNPNIVGTATSDIGTVTSAVKTVSIATSGSIWVRLNDPDGIYNNNIGTYTINIGRISQTTGFSNIFTSIINQIKTKITSSTQHMFENMTCTGAAGVVGNCTDYVSTIRAMLILYITIFGVMFIFGLIRTDNVDFIIRIIKITIIIALITPNSFNLFNQYLFSSVMKISDTLIAAAVGAPANNPFAFLEQSIAILVLDPMTYFKILSLMFQGLLGFMAFALLVYGAITFVQAIFNAIKVYVMALIGIAICFALAPIFIPFILFHRTAYLFENWLKALLRFAMEPVLLFIGLIMLNVMLLANLQQLFNFSACFRCTLPFTFSLPGFSAMGPMSLFCIPWFSPWGVDNFGTNTGFVMFFSMPLAITFCIIVKIMKLYSAKFARQISSGIFGGGTSMLSDKKAAGLGMNPFSDITSAYSRMTKGAADRKAMRKGLETDGDSQTKSESGDEASSKGSNALASTTTDTTRSLTGTSSGNEASKNAGQRKPGTTPAKPTKPGRAPINSTKSNTGATNNVSKARPGVGSISKK